MSVHKQGIRKSCLVSLPWKRFSFILIIFQVFVVLSAAPALAKPKQVVFIRYRLEPAYFTTVLNGFKTMMNARGFVEGRDIEYVDVLTRSAGEDSIPDVVAAVDKYKNSADMFITCGWVSLKVRELLRNTEVPQLFVPVLHSVALEMLPSVTDAPGTNLSGLYLMYKPEKILRLTRLVLPSGKNYAYVYDSRIPADQVFKKAYDQLDAKARHGFSLHFLDLAEGTGSVLAGLKRYRIDAFGGIVGVLQQRQALAQSGIPVITSYVLDIDRDSLRQYMGDDNIVAGLFNPFGYCGEQAAGMTADIFAGLTSIEKTVPRPAMQIAFVNLQNANKLKIPISVSVLEAVDFVLQ